MAETVNTPLNGITVGQREINSNKWLILISKLTKALSSANLGACQIGLIWSHYPINPIIRDPIKRCPLYN
jgi:hypothetical protein